MPVFDRKEIFLGRAFYNPRSEITLRLATSRDEPLDESWFRARIEEALSYRDSLEIDGDAYRLLHAEAGGIPGLAVDRYGEYLILQVGSAAVEERLGWIVGALAELLSPHGILLQGDSAPRKREGLDPAVRVLSGEAPESVVREGPVRYRADLRSGQKTGGFLDQRENHLAAGERYDTVILDPPAFARTRRELPKAQRAYKEINLWAMKLLNPGGFLITCSYHFSRELMEETLRSAAADAGKTMRVREWRGPAQDYPEILAVPETRYLKCVVLECL